MIFYLKYAIVQSLREKQFLFWMMFFPMLLCSAFYLGFSELDKDVDVKVRVGVNQDSAYITILNFIPVVDITKGDDDALKEQLQDETIDGYLSQDNVLYIKNDTFESDVIVSIFEDIKQFLTAFIIKEKDALNLNASDDEIINMSLNELAPYIGKLYQHMDYRDMNFKSSAALVIKEQETSTLKIMLFSAFAMFSIYGIFIGTELVNIVQSYLTPMAARVSISPYKKSHMVGAIFLASVILSLCFNLLLTLFVTYVLGVPMFNQPTQTILIYIVASIFASSLGILFGTIRIIPQNIKNMVINNVILVLSFISGMSGDTNIRSEIEQHIPILNRLNFVNVVNESLYQVNYIGNTQNLPRNLAILLGWALIILVLSSMVLRRQNYDSI